MLFNGGEGINGRWGGGNSVIKDKPRGKGRRSFDVVGSGNSRLSQTCEISGLWAIPDPHTGGPPFPEVLSLVWEG